MTPDVALSLIAVLLLATWSALDAVGLHAWAWLALAAGVLCLLAGLAWEEIEN